MPSELNKNPEKNISEQRNKEKSRKIAPGLYITSTPIGNLGDMTFRARDVLMQADVIACEDTRVTGKLLAYFDIKTPTVAYHDHNEQKILPLLMGRLQGGETVAVVSDAGTPLISDPGYRLVKEARQAGILVSSIPGASAILAALASAGLPTDRFMFAGFLPNKTQARRKVLAELASLRATLVFYESPRRLKDSLVDLRDVLGNREAAVCRELTKLFEEVRQGSLPELADHYQAADRPKGEIVILVAPPGEVVVTDAQLDDALHQALKTMSVKEAVASVTRATGLKRKKIYARALALTGKGAKKGKT